MTAVATDRMSAIYVLCHPDTNEVRYVGKTVVPLHTRLSQHCAKATKGVRTHLYSWIRSLAKQPTIDTLESVPYDLDADAEVRAVAAYRSWGARLTNATDGGEGRKGYLCSAETKAKIRAWNIGRKMPAKSPEALQRMSEGQRGKKLSAEHKAKLSGIGRHPTEETRAKLRLAKQAMTAETRAKMSAAKRGRPLSLAHKAKIGAGLLASKRVFRGVVTCRHPDRPHQAKGMCNACYNAAYNAAKKMEAKERLLKQIGV